VRSAVSDRPSAVSRQPSAVSRQPFTVIPLIFGTLLGSGCGREAPEPLLDTGWFTEPPDPECEAQILRTTPADGVTDWYHRNPLAVTVATSEDPSAYTATLYDADGAVVALTPSWSGPEWRLAPEAPLAPGSDYALHLRDCAGPSVARFSTSPLGAALAMDPSALVGRTYRFDMSAARWDEPPGIGAILSLYFTRPILIGVEWASDDLIDLLGAQGVADGTGGTVQFRGEPTWDFPVTSFGGAPYVEARAPEVHITFDGVELVVTDFTLSGTFSSDGATFGGGRVAGLGDTRHLGALFNQPGDEGAACDITEGFGAPCVPCPDDEPYCLDLSARDAAGQWLPDVTLVPE
jgi:hypothetical protein